MRIWVDDIRTPPAYRPQSSFTEWHWCKTSRQAIDFLIACKLQSYMPEIMSLDHDLGGEDTTRPIVLWMCENEFWPVEVVVHSANYVGVEWLEGMIERYHPSNAEKYER